jgi:hypothetical protein
MVWKRRNKYGARKTMVDGHKFDSQAEARHYIMLKQEQKDGKIASFELQPTIELQPKFKYKGEAVRAIKYKADFLVYHHDGTQEYIDVKGMRTQVFNMKWKMLKYKLQDEPNIKLTIA